MGTATTRRAVLRGTVAATAGLVAASATGVASAAPRPTRGWVPSWTTGMVPATDADVLASLGFTDTTLRQVLRLSAGGRPRIRFGNPFGSAPIVLGPATAALATTGGAVDPVTIRPITFGGRSQATLAAGAWLLTDPVALAVPGGADLAVSVHLPGPTGPVSFHRNAHTTTYLGPGDLTESPSAPPRTATSFFLVGAVETDGDPDVRLAVLGDSITEGVGTPDGANLRWPDQLARRLATGTRYPAIANLGISGNRVLLDDPRFGHSGQSRFDRDVLSLPGVDTLLVFLGINDIQQPPSQLDPRQVLDGYRQLVLRGHEHGLRVLGATVTPFEGWIRYTEALEQVRLAVNAAVRAGGIFDGVADFDAAVRDPARPSRLLPAYSSGDGLHPNAAGAAALAAAVDPRLLRRLP